MKESQFGDQRVEKPPRFDIDETNDIQMMLMMGSGDPEKWVAQYGEKFRIALKTDPQHFAELYQENPHACAEEIMNIAKRIQLPPDTTVH